MNHKIIIMLLLIIPFGFLFSQEDVDTPIPYMPDEFPEWTLDLRRAEIITIGSFPLAFLVTALVYDVSMSAASGFTAEFSSFRSQDDIRNIILISAGISVVIGLVDFIIHQVRKSKKEKEKQELNEQRKNNSQTPGFSKDTG